MDGNGYPGKLFLCEGRRDEGRTAQEAESFPVWLSSGYTYSGLGKFTQWGLGWGEFCLVFGFKVKIRKFLFEFFK